MPIPDPEAVWKIDQEKLKKLFPPSQFNEIDEKDEKEIEIIVNTAGDESLQWDSIALQHDYIALSEDSKNDSENWSNSSSEKSD